MAIHRPMTGRRRVPRPTGKRAQQLAVRWARWLLQFAATELEHMSEVKLRKLRADLDGFLCSDRDIRPVSTSGSARDADLRECHEWLRTGLATLARGEGYGTGSRRTAWYVYGEALASSVSTGRSYPSGESCSRKPSRCYSIGSDSAKTRNAAKPSYVSGDRFIAHRSVRTGTEVSCGERRTQRRRAISVTHGT